jgi:hypothetical protein
MRFDGVNIAQNDFFYSFNGSAEGRGFRDPLEPNG